jgi:cbb3-type cytochrome oxidase maturation protein
MGIILYLIGLSLVLGLCGLGLFLWSLSRGQFDDMEGAARRVLFDDLDEAEGAASAAQAWPQDAVATRRVPASK